jgi:hypothetical protein
MLSRHASAPGQPHLDAALDLVRYLYGTRTWSVHYKRTQVLSEQNCPSIFERSNHPDDPASPLWNENIQAHREKMIPQKRTIEHRLLESPPVDTPNGPNTYVAADLGGDRETRKSTSGMVIMMNGGPVTWSSRLQKLCAQSSAEAEISAVVDSVKEALHIKLLCEDAGLRNKSIPLTVYEDNNACIQMGHSLRGSQKAKHYELRLRFLNEQIREKNIEFSRIGTTNQYADGFTKPLALPNFRIFRNWMLVESPSADQ